MQYAYLFMSHFAQITAADCAAEKGQRLFGVIPKWYKYLEYKPEAATDKCAIHFNPSGEGILSLLPVGLAMIEMLLAIAGIVAVVYVVYGGFQYLTSQGEPDKLKSALHTIINALAGAAITIVASAAVSFVAGRLVT